MNTESMKIKDYKVWVSNFFFISTVLVFAEIIILYMVLKTPVTEFSQNIIKTFIFSALTISPFYALLVLLRVIKKKDRIMTVKQLTVFVLFALGFFIFTFAADSLLIATSLDIDKIFSNIFCFLVMGTYFVLQHIFLVRKNRKNRSNTVRG